MTRISATLLATVLAVVSQAAGAAKETGIVEAFHCTDVENDVARLECYDKAYAEFRIAAHNPGSWFIQTEVDPFDDTLTTFIGVNAEEEGNPLSGRRHQLVIRCRGSELSAWISWQSRTGDESPRIRRRIGDHRARTDQWFLSTSGNNTFYPHDPTGFVRNLMEADRFIAQLASGPSAGEIATFNIKGLEEAVEPIKQDCLSTHGAPPSADHRTRGERALERAVESMRQ